MKKLKFIHITKTAGTSIENIGIKHNIRWGRFHEEYGWWHGFFSKKSNDLKNKYNWFTVVRNPYSRIISEFYCKWGMVSEKIRNSNNKVKFNKIIQDRVKQRDKDVGNHWSDQYLYFDEKYDISILKFEELPDCFNRLMTIHNMDHIELNIQNNMSTKFFHVDDLFKETIEMINDEYHNDFIFLGYKKISYA